MIESSEAPDHSLTLQQMASFVAIAKTRNSIEVLDELVQQCFVVLPNESFATAGDILTAIQSLFPGLGLDEKEVAQSIDRLRNRNRLTVAPDGHLSLSTDGEREL